ncbi:hypothetical protein BDQ17DRAFT_332842 [Cyathus striatus]|nr:hypothetical protein BDQ17DRAFT_332842 [Cyathus striatus]
MADYTNDFRQSTREPSLAYPPTPSVIRRSESGVGSTRSWAYSQNPTNGDPSIITSPMRAPRPLPDPYRYSQAHQTLSVVNADPPEEDEEEEYMNIDPGPQQPGTQYGGYGYGAGSYEGGRPMSVREPRIQLDTENKSGFVGGFVKGLKRLPKSIFSYGKKSRQGTFGTDVTAATGATTTTLPMYASNPSTPNPGPSAGHYTGGTNIGSNLNRPFPSSLQPGPESRHRRIPTFSPPSQVPEQDEGSQSYEYSSPPPQFTEHPTNSPPDQGGARATVMVYQNTLASEPAPTPGDVSTHMSNNRLSRITTSISAPHAQSTTQAQHEPPQVQATPQPVSAHPLPAGDYVKMGALSPGRTARTTLTTWTSDEPSFSSELGSVQRFFYVLYHLPWASGKRVTVDYRPGVGAGGDGGGRGVVKKNATSWYRPPASTHPDIDLTREDAGPESRPNSGSNSTALLSPITGRTRIRRSATQHRRSNHHHHHHHHHTTTHHHRRHRRRGTISTTNSGPPEILQRASSPLIPPVYPFQYPPYPFFPAYPPRAHSPQGGHSGSRTAMYANGGYTPYQPMAAPGAPVVLLQSPQGSPGNGGQRQQGQVLAPVFMQVVPGAFMQEGGVGGHSSSAFSRKLEVCGPRATAAFSQCL